MSTERQTSANDEQTDEPDLGDLPPDEVADRIDGVTLDIPEDPEQLRLRDAMADIMTGHIELDAYRRGAASLVNALDEEITQAQNAGDVALEELLQDVRDSAYDLYSRIHPSERGGDKSE
jgi:hypothetical protein